MDKLKRGGPVEQDARRQPSAAFRLGRLIGRFRLGRHIGRMLPDPVEPRRQEPPEPRYEICGLDQLSQYLDRRRSDDDAAEQSEARRRQRIRETWNAALPIVVAAIEMVNDRLAPFDMSLGLPDKPDFFGPEEEPTGFGTKYRLSAIFDGHVYFVAREHGLEIANGHGEGAPLSLDAMTAELAADRIAHQVRWLLEG